VKRFDTFDIDDKKFEAIKQGLVGVNGKFDEIILDYNNALVGNIHSDLMKYRLQIFLDVLMILKIL